MHQITGEHSYRSAISIKLQSNFIEITLRHGCSPVNLMHIFRKPFLQSTSGRLLLWLKQLNIFGKKLIDAGQGLNYVSETCEIL